MGKRTPVIVALVLVSVGVAGVMIVSGNSGVASGPEVGQVVAPDTEPQRGTIHVSGSGAVSAQPEQAQVRVAVVTTSPNASTARAQLAGRVQRMRTALTEAGVDQSQIRTENYDINQDYREAREEKRTVQYRATHSFRITVSDLDRAGTVIDTAVANGANRVNGIEFTIPAERRSTLRTRALQKAMQNARQEAETVAARANMTITGVERIRTTNIDTDGFEGGHAAAAATPTPSAETSIETGALTVSAQVKVTYNMTAV